MTQERKVFDPLSIESGLRERPADGLRMLADAIDAGELEVRLLGAHPHGLHAVTDSRMHVRVVLDVAAEGLLMEGLPLLTAAEERSA